MLLPVYKFLSKYGETMIAALCASVIAASPVAIEGKSGPIVYWTALAAAAAYTKGRLDPVPGGS